MGRVLCITAAVLAVAAMPVTAGTVFDQGFETDTAGWNDYLTGVVTRVASGTGGVTSATGGYHAIMSDLGPFSRFDGYRDTWPSGGYVAEAAVYLDTGWADGAGFDLSVAANGSDGSHQRDFIFHTTRDSSGSLLVGASNNTNFLPRQDLGTINHYAVGTSGWYTYEWVFRDDSGVLAVDLNLRDALGGLLFTETRSNAGDLIPAEVGGNRYMWLTAMTVGGGLHVDDTRLNLSVVPVPSAAWLGFGLLGVLGAARSWRRRRRSS